MTYTLLDLVQTILSSMDSDEVNSYDDTTESLQVSYIIRDTYNDIMSRMDHPSDYGMYTLTASGDSTKPTLMTLPSNAQTLEWVRYNIVVTGNSSPKFVDVPVKPLDQFVEQMYLLDTDEMTNTGSYSYGDFKIIYRNDAFPTFYTTFDNQTVIFDSYNSDEDTTLQSSKTLCYGQLSNTFTMSNTFTPVLDDKGFTILLNESKDQAFAELKQTQNVIAAKRARQGWIANQKQKRKIKDYDYRNMNLPDYSRRVR